MGRFEVQGIVSSVQGLPMVQFRLLDEDDELIEQWQSTPAEAREIAQKTVEASMNAVYDAAIFAFCKEKFPNDPATGNMLVSMIRDYRADAWGLPDRPEDWRS